MNEIIRQAQEDPTLYATVDIHELLDSLNDEKYDYIMNHWVIIMCYTSIFC